MHDVASPALMANDTPGVKQKSAADRADNILRSPAPPAGQATYELAEALRRANDFGRARRLYGRIRDQKLFAGLKVTVVKVGQAQALATYKDPDLPAADRFRRALEILDEVERLDFSEPPALNVKRPALTPAARTCEQRQESLGLRGAIYKRRWQLEGQRADLENAFGFYFRGYRLGRDLAENPIGVETDFGYTAINAAYVLNLLAIEEAKHARFTKIEPVLARQRYEHALEIRTFLVESLPRLTQASWLLEEWWFHATLAEAYLGLGKIDEALNALRAFNRATGLKHDGPPLEKISRWEFESTLSQLASLADMYAALEPDLKPESGVDGDAWKTRWRDAFRSYLGNLESAMERVEMGKVGLALSGGGLRASLFHVGVLAYLAERDMLRRVEVLSCVSGGSIVGAHYYLEVQELLRTTADGAVGSEHYRAIVERLQTAFLDGVQTNIRCQVFASLWANLRALLQPGYTTTRHLGALYERVLYSRVKDPHHGEPRYLPQLAFIPAGEPPADFKPKYDNWRRHAKVPTLVLNATTLNTGHNWQFTASFMGESPASLDAEIEGNYRLRRMYYHDAPRLRNRWSHALTRPFAPPDYRQMRLGEAVAASSCVPGLFEPIVLSDLYTGKVVRLVDGGVFDNQGVAGLLEQDCSVMIVSDASGQMDTDDNPSAARLGVSLRSFGISMTRVRQAQYRELAARDRAGLLKRFVFLHLKRDLTADPVDWRQCPDPRSASDQATPAHQRGPLTTYQIPRTIQQALASLRTDLDSFSELEATALMTSGYRQAESQFEKRDDWPARNIAPWGFLKVERELEAGGPHFEEVTRLLDIGSRTAFKALWVAPVVGVMVGGLCVGLLLGLLYLGWRLRAHTLLTVGQLGVLTASLALGTIAPQVFALVRYKQTIRKLGLQSLLGLALALLFKLHLKIFDAIFLKRGKLARFGRADS